MNFAEIWRSGGSGRLSLVTIAGGLTSLVAAGVIVVLVVTGVVGADSGRSGPDTETGLAYIDPAMFFTPTPVPTPTPEPPSDAPIERFLIPKYDVDAPVTVKKIDGNGVMENPDGPWDVAWYEFSGRPGFGSNAVFSGHVDYINVGAAVFWNVSDLVDGDIVEVRLTDGTLYQFRVFDRYEVEAAADVSQIVAPTEEDIVTLITCIGSFNAGTGSYDKRLIVRAKLVTDDETVQSSPGAEALIGSP
jgi:LPXTG-site transpeptidase (sortase) family protein